MQLPVALLFLLITSLSSLQTSAQGRFEIRYHQVGKDTFLLAEKGALRNEFSSRSEGLLYLENLVRNRQSLGFLSFSIDSLYYTEGFAEVWIHAGSLYRWASLEMDTTVASLFQSMGLPVNKFEKAAVDPVRLVEVQEQLLGFLENNGYPFAAIRVDSIRMEANGWRGIWMLDKGPLYRIDSITITGSARIDPDYFHQYLGIPRGSVYRKDRLDDISARIRELSFLQESRKWELTRLGTGATLSLYLDARQSSQVSALVGLLPASDQAAGKVMITGDVSMQLMNALGKGEHIGLNWQQLQVRSPRLNLRYSQPYLFRSAFGVDMQFDLFRKDSSFLNLQTTVGIPFRIDSRSRGRIFYQQMATNLIGVDTSRVKVQMVLPDELDVRSGSFGIDYHFTGTDYRMNPRKGAELSVTVSGGIRRVRKNNLITGLTHTANGQVFDFGTLYDPLPSRSYMVRTRIQAARYWQTGRQTTIRTAFQGGLVAARGIYRNELFQIGGYRLLRGFDEESIYTDRYGVMTGEFRYLIGMNAFLSAFTDAGWAAQKVSGVNRDVFHAGAGMGLMLETKSGMLNLSYAVGKREGQPFSLRQAKIHVGFVSIF